ncbi:MAG: hypothetical protein ABSB80_10455 [Methanoregula sp.]|jgi:DNA/RNA endonuclease YhcR with UshA esterase domain|uniref:hypothetical protein n=1 Tax=Methanoregula sp. TaxID=2052170 RepID=UPI003D123BB2
MFVRQERVAALLLVGVAVVVIGAHLVLDSVGKQPFARTFTNASADGELVMVEGTVSQATLTRSGGHMVLSLDEVSVFVPAQAAEGLTVHKGDRISVYGTVQMYQGKKEILVSSGRDIRIMPAE